MPDEVRADLAPFAAVAVALGALLLEDHLAARRRLPPRSTWAVSRSITFWRSGSGRPPPCASSRLARAAIVRIRVGGQGLLLVERQLGDPDLVLLERLDQGRGPVGAAEQGPEHLGADARRQRRQDARPVACPTSGALLGATASIRPAASSGERAGRDQFEQCCRARPRRPAVSSTSCRAASIRRALGERLVAGRCQQRRGNLGADAVEGLVAPLAHQADQLGRAGAGSSIASSLDTLSAATSSLRRPVLGPASGHPPEHRFIHRGLTALQRGQDGRRLRRSGRRAPSARPRARRSRAPPRRRDRLCHVAAIAFKNARSFRAAAAVAASTSQWSSRASPAAVRRPAPAATSSDGG